jgi:serine/threonine-protein kinase
MAPERRERPGAGGPASDVYALAALAYELLSGRVPGRNGDLGRDWPGATDAATQVLERGLDPDPARRQPTAGRLVDDLEAAVQRGGAARNGGAKVLPFEPPPIERNGGATAARTARPPRSAGRNTRLAAIIGLALLGLALLAAVGMALGGGGDDGGSGKTEPLSAPGSQNQDLSAKEPAPAPEPAPSPEPAPQEPAPAPEAAASGSAADLNDQGFALINQGRYDEAIPILERAVDGSEGSPGLTYAYALFNLGNALRLAGRPEEAIPVLEQRLQIPNQRGTVTRELELARREAGE